jgi:hypothetical protein
MKTSIRPIAILVILAILLAPGLSFAKTVPVHSSSHTTIRTDASSPQIFSAFTSVWNLLTQHLKSGIGLDPSGSPTPPSSTSSDTGTQLDPSGGPK